jgi:hypothetical protein
LCVIYQLNFIIGMCVNEKRLIYRVRYYPQFRASAVGLGTYHPHIRGDYCISVQNLYNFVCDYKDISMMNCLIFVKCFIAIAFQLVFRMCH